ncbi:MAG TPA: twin-arginine translocation signal domain-containing protein [Bacteroidales bacterium]|nr:twin-arginine translocation signal domain-containing protein [Bacteroidales bacterium]
MKRRTFLKNTGMAAGMLAVAPLLGNCKTAGDYEFDAMDLHVHTTDQFTIEQAMKLAEERKVKFGIVDHPAQWAIKDDTDLKKYIDNLRKYPVYVGLQPMITGWEKSFSPELLAQLDYVLMDPQTIPLGNDQYQFIWQLETYIEDTEAFMEQYMAHSLNILNKERINIFGWPLFLPVCIARDYYTLWTDERMQQIIAAARARNIAIEINDMAHTPHEKFILMAKEQGLKFTFGSDSRNNNAGKLVYCKSVAKKCNLQPEDFYVPGKA